MYAQQIDKVELPSLLMELSSKYWDQLEAHATQTKRHSPVGIQLQTYHQCKVPEYLRLQIG